jgi:carboxylesterase type B
MSETREILASFNGNTSTLDYGVPVNATLAGILQGYITSFAMTGDPKRRGLPYWSEYGSNSSVQNMSFVGGCQRQTQ